MSTIESLQNRLIDQILRIQNEEVLEALETLAQASVTTNHAVTPEQRKALQQSEADIAAGRMVSQADLKSRTTQWLS